MQRKIFISLIIVVVLTAAMALLLQRNDPTQTVEETSNTSPEVVGSSSENDELAVKFVQEPSSSFQEQSLPMPDEPAGASPQENYRAYVSERISELMDLSTESDANSLNTIISELTNRDPAIRKAVVEAAVQFGSRDAIPGLQDAAFQVEDIEEKVALARAVEFLQLTNVTEVITQQKSIEGTRQQSKRS